MFQWQRNVTNYDSVVPNGGQKYQNMVYEARKKGCPSQRKKYDVGDTVAYKY